MPFKHVLADLLARNEDAIGAIFLDEEGETVDVASSDMPPADLRIVGAYLAIYLRQAEAILDTAGLGRPRWLHIEREQMHLHVRALPDGYYLALVQRTPAIVSRARLSLHQAAEKLTYEVFKEPAG